MLDKIRITNPIGRILEIDLKRPEKSGLFIRSITGLGAPNANLSYNSNVTVDGSTLSSSNVENRNIVIDFGFYYWSSESIEQIRNKTYQFFPIKREIKFDIFTDLHPNGLTIQGFVEKNEPDIFSNEEGCQISIICPDPYFRNLSKIDDRISIVNDVKTKVSSIFTFPFPNSREPYYSSNINNHIFSKNDVVASEGAYDFDINNKGTIDCGMTVKIYINAPSTNVIRFEVDGLKNSFRIHCLYFSKVSSELDDSFHSGDIITVSTIPGKLSITLNRNGKTYNIMNSVSYLTTGLNPWPLLVPGINHIHYTGYSFTKQIDIEIDTQYEGV